jgi:hypothetical protein
VRNSVIFFGTMTCAASNDANLSWNCYTICKELVNT